MGPRTIIVIPGAGQDTDVPVDSPHFRDAPPEHTKPLYVARYGALGGSGSVPKADDHRRRPNLTLRLGAGQESNASTKKCRGR